MGAPPFSTQISAAAAGLPATLKTDVEELLAGRFGAAFEMLEYHVLAARTSRVGRITAMPCRGGANRTFIVKHVPQETYGVPSSWKKEFREEAAAYELFCALDPPFAERPERLGFHANGLLLLEDLGHALNLQPVADDLTGAFATLFARLHAATAGREQAYDEVRSRFGLQPSGCDDRQDGVDNRRRQFEIGAQALGEWCELLGICRATSARAQLEAVREAVVTPGPLHAVTHDDLAHGRQCVYRDGRLLMFDFENARYGLMLLDLAKALVGKFERHHPSRVMVLSWPGMRAGLADQYRRELARAGGPTPSDAEWETSLADAMIFTAVCQVGVLRVIIERGQVLGAFLPNLRKLLHRVETVLARSSARRELRGLLSALDQRIAIA